MSNEPPLPNLPNLGVPIPPTDPARAAQYRHPRPGMQVAYDPYQQASHYPPGYYPPPPGYPPPPQGYPQQQQPAPPPPQSPEPQRDGPPVRGLAPYQPAGKVKLGDVEYGLRDLGSEDAFALWQIITDAASWGTDAAVRRYSDFVRLLSGHEKDEKDKKDESKSTEEGAPKKRPDAWILPIMGPFLGVNWVRKDLSELVASVLLHTESSGGVVGSPLTPEAFARIPWRHYQDLYQALQNHPDLTSFFGWFRAKRAAPAGQALTVIGAKVMEVAAQMGLDQERPGPSSTAGNGS